MIKANEFRIGNLLRDEISKTELKVIGLTEENISTYVIDRDKFPLKNGWGIEPIPLTEECLLKFGFKQSIQHQAHYLNGFDFVIDICTDYSRVIKYKRGGEVMTRIQHVHQLQNLYFALTGEELTIKEVNL